MDEQPTVSEPKVKPKPKPLTCGRDGAKLIHDLTRWRCPICGTRYFMTEEERFLNSGA